MQGVRGFVCTGLMMVLAGCSQEVTRPGGLPGTTVTLRYCACGLRPAGGGESATASLL